MKKNGFTLLELIAVIVIIGILATLSISHYGPYREKAMDKEAVANLQLIRAAEKIYRMEEGFYYPYNQTVATTSINDVLRLSLPAKNWDYTAYGYVSTRDFIADAKRKGVPNKPYYFTINATLDEPRQVTPR